MCQVMSAPFLVYKPLVDVRIAGAGGHFLCMAIDEDESVDGSERLQLGLRRGIGARGVGDAR